MLSRSKIRAVEAALRDMFCEQVLLSIQDVMTGEQDGIGQGLSSDEWMELVQRYATRVNLTVKLERHS